MSPRHPPPEKKPGYAADVEILIPIVLMAIWAAWFCARRDRIEREDQAVDSLGDRLAAWIGPGFPRVWFLVSRDLERAVCVSQDLSEFILYAGSLSSLQRFPSCHLRRAELIANESTSMTAVGVELGLGVGVGSAAVVKRIDTLKVRLHLRDADMPFFDVCVFRTDVGLRTSSVEWQQIETSMASHLSRLELIMERGASRGREPASV